MNKLPKIYCDMDGVLVDFEKNIVKYNKMSIDQWAKIPIATRWEKVIANKRFWHDAPWHSEGIKLWNFIKKYDVHILSAYVEHGNDPNCIPGKTHWVKSKLGLQQNKINLVRRKDKQNYANATSILIDDYKKNTDDFTRKGGIGIQFTNASVVISKLKKLGF